MLFGSNHDGERAAAAAKADAIVRQHGLTWGDVFHPAPSHEAMFRLCIDSNDTLTDWEHEFLRGIAGQASMSEKQRSVLDRLYRKVRP